ncbi:hypothetical protein DUI87_08125 [Hirundo rustica rustica]|uniref:Uncharacterized protein n=1 Tax=Hirundo rustica rustica TaxID=333673 RepID=A0A3M0KRL2_HIRRU|nr:hypothetical protein DUI87_08125 [Hirundo rustica rustica]
MLLTRLKFQTLHQLCCPSLNKLQHLKVCFVVSPEMIRGFDLTIAEYRGTVTALVLLATLLLIQARMPLALMATWTHVDHVQLLSTSTPSPFPLGYFPAILLAACSAAWCWCDRNQHFTLINLMALASSHHSSLFRSLCRAVLPSSRSTLPFSVVLSANLLKVQLDTLVQIMDKGIRQDWPQKWGTPLVISHQLDTIPLTPTL